MLTIMTKVPLIEQEKKALDLGQDPCSVIGSICARSWFTRLWAVQEYVLSHNATFICGESEIEAYKIFPAMGSLFKRRRSFYGESVYGEIWQDSIMSYVSVFSRMREHLKESQATHHCYMLTELLSEGRNQRASKPRDAIFAMYGLIRLFNIPFPVPNYTKTVELVYVEATKSAITFDRSLLVLLEISGNLGRRSLPSWVPDWNVKMEHTLSVRNLRAMNYFRASRSSTSTYEFLNDDRVLSVRGKVVDTIDNCAEEEFHVPNFYAKLPLHASKDNSDRFQPLHLAAHTIFRNWMSLARDLSSYPNGDDLETAFRRTVILDYTRWSQSQLSDQFNEEDGFKHWLQSLLLGRRLPHVWGKARYPHNGFIPLFRPQWKFEEDFLEAIGPENIHIAPSDLAKYAIQSISRNTDAKIFQELALTYSVGMSFFTTASGYMGKGLPSIEIDDVILLIAGVDVPMVAQKVGGTKARGTYRLKGPAYVHGIMHGEKWPVHSSSLVDLLIS